MKTKIYSRGENAVALIIVLAMLVLLSGLIVSFMNSVGNERAASFANNNEVTSRQIADSTVNLVINQIREATSQSGLDTSIPTTWASQPGAIRTLSGAVGTAKTISTGASGVKQFTYVPGANDNVFKLYSAAKMKIPVTDFGGKAWDSKEIDVIRGWDRTNPEKFKGYVDLNEPIASPLPAALSKGDPRIVEPRYPIIDPRAKFDGVEKPSSTADPGIVDGFDIKTTGLDDPNLKYLSKDRTGKAGIAQKLQYLPMPVKWLYIMRNGMMAAADDSTGKIPGATADNPIVGRTGFWTDDDSCRLNVNTASEGTFWDTPHGSSEHESGNVSNTGLLTSSTNSLSLGASQPVKGEYQRYPGHPATTSLSPAFGWMWNIMPKDAPRQTRDTALLAMKDAITQLSPFSPYGKKGQLPLAPPNSTTMGASINTDTDYPLNDDPESRAIPQLAVATKRLYTTVDEMVFKQDRVTPADATPTVLNSPNIIPESLEKIRFFLTPNSRSPELNIFGRPRVTFWPVSAKEVHRTTYDDLFAFTSTFYKDPSGDRLRDNIFYFTRYDAKSNKNDYRSAESGLIQRNVDIIKYLNTVTSSAFPIPSFGGSFEDKYGKAEKEQILTEIFDYCRAVNLVDTSTRKREGSFRSYTPKFSDLKAGTSGYQDFSVRSNDWSGQVTPIRIESSQYQGLGRFPTISEAAMIFYRTGTIRTTKPDGTAGGDNRQAEMRAALIFEMTNPMAGNPAIRETYWTRVTPERDTFVTVSGTTPAVVKKGINLVAPVNKSRINIVNVGSHDVGWSRSYMPTLGFMNQVCYYTEPSGWTDSIAILAPNRPIPPQVNAKPKTFSNSDPSSEFYKRGTTSTFYPYVSDKFPAPEQGTATPTLKFTGGRYRVEIFSGEAPWTTDGTGIDPSNAGDPRSTLVQTIYIDFGADKEITTEVPLGKLSADASLDKRITGKQDDRPGFPNGNGFDDVVRSLEYVGVDGAGKTLPLAQQGDFRLSITRQVVPAEAFTPRSPTEYFSTAKTVHGLQRGWGSYYEGSKPTASNPGTASGRGTFAKGATFRDDKSPVLPAGINGVQNADGGAGDWDRGLSKHMDGSLGGKVDEGNVYFDYGSGDDGGRVPYFRGRGIEETGVTFFSPNRQLSSAVMFGSLPTGVVRGRPWQTLLFRPDRGAKSHPGAQGSGKAPADHLFLDLFNLPIVEPYAISEPFSSGGKVNINYVIAPFGYAPGDAGKYKTNKMERSYIRRDTALRGVLKAVKLMAIPTAQPSGGHTEGPATTGTQTQFRFDIDADKTLDQFEDRLKDPSRGLFRSASEICDMDLYPVGLGVTDWATFWETTYGQTGDNMRERPYSHIYPRITTKSNIYTIFMRCQSVKKAAGSPPDEFDLKRDRVVGGYRGSATIERFIDPNDAQLANYDPNAKDSSVDKFYRFRVLSTKQFLPR